MTRRDLFRQVTGAVAVGAAPILSGATLAQRLIVDGMSMSTWRLAERVMGAQTFSCYSIATARATGYLGWFVDKTGRVVGWLRADGALLRLTRGVGHQQAPAGPNSHFAAAIPGHARWIERIGTAVPMDHRNPVNW